MLEEAMEAEEEETRDRGPDRAVSVVVPVKNEAGPGGSSREATRPAVTGSQCPAWLSTSKPGNRSPGPDCRRWW